LSDDKNLFPIVILQDRYGGSYSKGAWLAIACADEPELTTPAGILNRAEFCLSAGPFDGDIEAREFWDKPPPWIAVGNTPDGALANLKRRG
jgi:hypothetical protein